MSCANSIDANQNRGPTRWVAFALRERFAAGKTLAEGQFICPEHVKSPEGGGGLWPPGPKKKGTLFSVSFFLSCPNTLDAVAKSVNGPSGPRRECGVNSECRVELRRGGFADPEYLNLRRVEAALSRRNPKRKTRFSACLSFCLVRKV